MDTVLKNSNANSNRFVIEDSIPKVTSDGEPHEMMTLLAVVSGLLAAIIVLSILITLIGCRENDRPQNPDSSLNRTSHTSSLESIKPGKISSILPVFTAPKDDDGPKLISVAVISNQVGNDNAAFHGSNLRLYQSVELQVPSIADDKF